jgi:hypothetical protein
LAGRIIDNFGLAWSGYAGHIKGYTSHRPVDIYAARRTLALGGYDKMTLPYSVGPLAPGLAFGATVSGLKQEHLASDAVRKGLIDLWTDKGVILFRGGESSQAMQVALSGVFGKPQAFPFKESRSEGAYPELVNIKYYPDDGTAYAVDGEVNSP